MDNKVNKLNCSLEFVLQLINLPFQGCPEIKPHKVIIPKSRESQHFDQPKLT